MASGISNLTTTKLKGGNYGFTGVVASFTSPFTSAADLSAPINWGDGSSSTAQIVWNSNTDLWDVVGTHQYNKKGTYTLLITIEDAAGNTATASSTLTAG